VNIAVVTKSLRSGGGASRFAFELADSCRERGDDVRVFTYSAQGGLPDCERVEPLGIVDRLTRHLDWRLSRLGFVGFTGWDFRYIRRKTRDFADIIHVHDSYEAISPITIGLFTKLAPVLHTMHDTSSLTGGCINPMGCERYRKGCGRCPQRNSLGKFDLTSLNLRIRRKVYSNPRIRCSFPSRWIMGEACASLSLGSRAHHVANGFDPRGYAFKPRLEARRILGIPEKAMVVCAGAHTVASPHKGFMYVVNALRANEAAEITLILLGNVAPEAEELLSGVPVVAPGFVGDKERLALYYSAADLMLFPSMGDNLPTMIQESMYAQTPVLAFATGGIPEMITDGRDGWLVPRGDGIAFAAALRRLLSNSELLKECGLKAKVKIAQAFSMQDCYSRYEELYRHACSAQNQQFRYI